MRINTKIGYGSAKATIPIPALANIGYGIGYCTPLHLVCVGVLKAGLKTETGFCTVCDFAHARPIMLSILLVIMAMGAIINTHAHR